MKKFFKVCGIIVLVLVIAGGVMFGVSMALSGTESLSKAATEISDGWLTFDLTDGIHINIGGKNVEEFLKDNKRERSLTNKSFHTTAPSSFLILSNNLQTWYTAAAM